MSVIATRRERVILDLEDNLSAGMVRAAGSTALLNRELDATNRSTDRSGKSTDRLSGSMTRLRGETSRANVEVEHLSEQALPAVGRNTASTEKQIDKLSGRLELFAQAAVVLGPALVPIGAAAVPALAGLTTQLGVAGIAAGTTVLAFHGVGDALKALNTYDLEPSQANFEKLQESMRGLGPSAREFVTYLHSIGPELSRLRVAAQDGVLPGAEQGIKNLMTLAPRAEAIISNVATTVGSLLADAGDDLAGPEWRAFFDYLQSDAAPILIEMAHTAGNFTQGLAAMLVGFSPLTAGFSAGFEDMSQSFADWAAGLDTNDGFQSFVAYVQQSGPQVLNLLGSLANMLVQVVTAAAPLGGPVVNALASVADIVATIADSDLGTPIFTAAAAFALLSRASAAFGAVGKSSVAQFITGQKTLQSTLDGTRTKLTGLGGQTGAGVVASFREMTAASKALEAAETKRAAAAVRARDAQSALLPATTKRGAVSDYMDSSAQVAVASERVVKAEKARSAAIRETAASAGKAAALVGGFALATSGVAEKSGLANTASLALMGTIAGPWGAAIGGGVGLALDFAQANGTLKDAITAANAAAGSNDLDVMRAKLASLRAEIEHTKQGVDGSGVFDNIRGAIGGNAAVAAGERAAASLATQTRNIKNGVGGVSTLLGGQLGPALGQTASSFERAAQSGDDFRASLQAVNDFMEGRASFRAYQAALDDFAASLQKNGKAAGEFTEAGRANNQALDNIATSANSWAEKLKGVDRVDFLARARKQFIAAAEDMGKTGKQARQLADDAGLLSNVDPTLKVKVDGADKATTQMRALMHTYDLTPRDVKTIVSEAGSNPSRAKLLALQAIYGLTPRQILTLIRANDAASGPAKNAKKNVEAVHDRSVSIRATENASSAAARARAAMASVRDRLVHITTVFQDIHRHSGDTGRARNAIANGGMFEGSTRTFATGGFTDDGEYVPRVPQIRQGGGNVLWSEPETGWEAYISGKPGMEDRNIAIWRAAGDRLGVEFEEFAIGGLTAYANGHGKKRHSTPASRFDIDGGQTPHKIRAEFAAYGKAIGGLTPRIRDLEKAAVRVAKEYNQQARQLKSLQAAAKDTRSATSSALLHDPFGNGVAGLTTQLTADRNDSRAFAAAFQTLKKKHIGSGLAAALAASGDLNTAQQLAGMSRAQVAAESQLYASTQRAAGAAGKTAADAAYGRAIREHTTMLKKLSHHMENLEDRVERGARHGVADRERATHQRKKNGR